MNKTLRIIFGVLLALSLVLALCHVLHSCGVMTKSPVQPQQTDGLTVAEPVLEDPAWMELPAPFLDGQEPPCGYPYSSDAGETAA